jgi:hypothetical protein
MYNLEWLTGTANQDRTKEMDSTNMRYVTDEVKVKLSPVLN